MGFFWHLVMTTVDLSDAVPASEPMRSVDGLYALRVSDRSPLDWARLDDRHHVLAERAFGGFVSASVIDSDGALLAIGVPGHDMARAWLHLDGRGVRDRPR